MFNFYLKIKNNQNKVKYKDRITCVYMKYVHTYDIYIYISQNH